MNTKEKINVHNKFIIEVRDAKTNELKQVGHAENIVLDSCGLWSEPSEIRFGSGTDQAQQLPSMTKLIEHIGSKRLFLLSSKWENNVFVMEFKSQQIETHEFNGKIISEVGIQSDSITNYKLMSHAFIKDSEGNPLTITKTDKDVIILYATIYYKRTNEIYRFNQPQQFYHFKLNNNNVSATTESEGSISLSRILEINDFRRVKGYLQISNEDGNGKEIRALYIENNSSNIYKVIVFPQTGLYEGTQINKGKLIGEKNSVNKQFDLPWDCVRSLKIYKNDQLIPESQYTVNTNVKKSNNILKDVKKIETDGEFDETYIYDLSNKKEYTIPFKKLFNVLLTSRHGGTFYLGNVKNLSEYTIELNKPSIISHYEVNYRYVYGTNNDGRYNNMKIDVYSNEQWVEVYSGNSSEINKRKLTQDIENVVKVRVKLTNPKSDRMWKQIPWIALYNENDIHHITFNEPPLATDVLEYDGFVDYIPKDEDHIVKFNFDMTLSPGAGE